MASSKTGGAGRAGRISRRNRASAGALDAEFDSILGGSPDLSPSAGIRPTGRAPRGMGGEYADRRTIANKIDSLSKNAATLTANVNRYRGQKNQRWRISQTRERISILKKAIRDTSKVANGPGDWSFKKELVNAIASSVVGQATG